MASDPLLTNFFGPGATQNATQLIIAKADLIPPAGLDPTYEFVPAATNTSESMALGMFLRWARNLDISADRQLNITPWEQVTEFRNVSVPPKYQIKFTSKLEIFIDSPLGQLPNPNLI